MTTTRAIGLSARSARFQRASDYYWGRQYDALPTHYDPEARDLSLRERAPAVQVGLVPQTVDTVVGYLFGAARLPNFYVDSLIDESTGDEVTVEDGADEEEIKRINADIAKIRRWSGLDKYLREIGRLGALHGSVGLAGHVLSGEGEAGRSAIWCEVLELADAYPKFGREDRAAALEAGLQEDDLIELDEFWAEVVEPETNDEETTYKIHRRLWTLTGLTEFEPHDAETLEDVNVRALEWVEDVERSVTHDLNMIPVVWIKNRLIVNSLDGAPILVESDFLAEDEINYTLTQAGRGTRYNCEPQVVFKDCANVIFDDQEVARGSENSLKIESKASPAPEAKVELLEMNGAGIDRALAYSGQIRSGFGKKTRVVEHDPEKAVGALSGTAIERLMMPLLGLIDELRPAYAVGLARWFELMLKALNDGADYVVKVEWPPVLQPTLEDLALVSGLISTLRGGMGGEALITRRQAVALLSSWTNVDDVDAALAQLEEEEASAGTMTPGEQPTT